MDDRSAPETSDRRSFLNKLLGIGFGSTAAAIFYPVWRYIIPPKTAEAPTTSVVATKAAEMAPNTGIVFKFGNKPAILVRTPDGSFKAFSAVCTHLDCTVQYRTDTSQIWCACHNGIYDLAGNVVSGPPPHPLEAFAVNLRGDPGAEEVVVSRG